MLTSLLSLYIASSLDLNLANNLVVNEVVPNIESKIASFSLASLDQNNFTPIKNPRYISPIIDARSSIVVDLSTGKILYEKNKHQRLAIASITKLMTALVILEENNLDEITIVSTNAANTEGSTMHLRIGEEISIENLLLGIIVNSANDAAISLAEHNAGTVEVFVEKMNKRASELGLINSNFTNPTGLDDYHNYSSSYDIAKLGRFIYNNKFIQSTAEIKNIEVSSVTGDYIHYLENTNELLDSYLKVKGLKTGKTDKAGLCLTAIAENNKGHEILTVLLDSPARFTETKILIDWIFKAYKWY